jgi:hypothetical protein
MWKWISSKTIKPSVLSGINGEGYQSGKEEIKMGKCGKCGADVKESAKFCKSCGGNALLSDKKARVMTGTAGEKSWVKPAVIAAVLIAVVAGFWMFRESRAANQMGGQPAFSPQRDASGRLANAVRVTAEGGVVHIPVRTVEDGNAHFFAYETAGKTITFFAVKAADGSVRTAFDACMACNHAKLGYRQEGSSVVCNNCGMGFSPADIGRKTGGCNPIPVEKTVDGQMIVLNAKDLEAGVQYF